MKYLISFYFLFFFSFSGCTSVKPYERVYLNDPEMSMGRNAGEKFEDYIQTIREGGLTAGSSKSSGGCGCN